MYTLEKTKNLLKANQKAIKNKAKKESVKAFIKSNSEKIKKYTIITALTIVALAGLTLTVVGFVNLHKTDKYGDEIVKEYSQSLDEQKFQKEIKENIKNLKAEGNYLEAMQQKNQLGDKAIIKRAIVSNQEELEPTINKFYRARNIATGTIIPGFLTTGASLIGLFIINANEEDDDLGYCSLDDDDFDY